MNTRSNLLAFLLFGALLFTAIVVARAAVLNNSSKTPINPRIVRNLVGPNGNIHRALNQYKFDMGRYPKVLEELIERPNDNSEAKKWTGPYVTDKAGFKDPWDNEFQYASPGKKNKGGIDIWSKGPD